MRHARSLPLLALAAAAASLPAGCGGAHAEALALARAGQTEAALRAYERVAEREGPARELLATLAAELLLREATQPPEEAAVEAARALGSAGLAAEPWLRRLLDRREAPAAARAAAALALARAGDRTARALLRAWAEHPDGRVRAAALRLARWPADARWVLRALRHGTEEERRAAATVLAGATGSHAEVAREALHEAARRDASPRVRAATLRALGAHGPAELPLLLEAARSGPLPVRLAALQAAVRADPAASARALAPWWSRPPSAPSVEAARLIARERSLPGAARRAALGHLRSALAAEATSVRAQAAVAWISVGAHLARPDLRSRLALERRRAVRLQLARALARVDEEREAAAEALAELAEGEDLVAAQAAADLARFPDAPGERATGRLRALLRAEPPLVRAVAARGLCLDAGRPELARSALLDEDGRVRREAAAAILAASR